jgi:hydrogenase/urease accessory protein HupE
VTRGKLLPGIALTQGTFYLATGIWPLLDIDSFQAVTGPKTDLWLVRTVGVLVAVIGAVLVTGARRRTLGPEITLLAVGSALGLAAIDIIYVLGGTISPVYLADAVAEIGLAAIWALGWRRV